MSIQMTLFEMKDTGLISPAQREIAKTNPYFKLFSNKSLEELGATDQTLGKSYYPPDKHPLLEAYWTAQTIALEKVYQSLDERLLRPFRGSFQLRLETGEFQTIDYEFEPDYAPMKKPRTTPPQPRVQFFSDQPSPISATGYLNHFLDSIPYSKIGSMEDLIAFIIKTTLDSEDYEIIFSNTRGE
jgi:hypothetical protein